MAHFYGSVQGNSATVTRCGTKSSGVETYCASWEGAVRCHTYIGEDGRDYVLVEKVRWLGAGEKRLLYDGPIGKVEEVECDHPRHRNPGLTIPCPECEKRKATAATTPKEAAGIDRHRNQNFHPSALPGWNPHFPDVE